MTVKYEELHSYWEIKRFCWKVVTLMTVWACLTALTGSYEKLEKQNCFVMYYVLNNRYLLREKLNVTAIKKKI